MANLENLKIGAFVLDPSRNLLTGDDREVSLEPKVVDVLVALAAQPGTVLSRDDLIDTVWKAEFGADERLTRAISQLRKAFGDERGAARYIETVSKRGYRLVAAVAVVSDTSAARVPASVELSPAPEPSLAPAEPVTVPRSRSVRDWQPYAAGLFVVLVVVVAAFLWRGSAPSTAYARDLVALRPVVVIAGNPELDGFARQMHASLKRILASNHLSVVEQPAVEVPQKPTAIPASEFIMTTTVERTGARYAVTVSFDDRASGQTVWSRRFVRAIADGEDFREEVGANTAYIIGCGLVERTAARTDPTLEAFKIYLEVCDPQTWFNDSATALVVAQRLIATTPDDAYGYGLAAIANAQLGGLPDLTAAEAAKHKAAARAAASRARALDPESPHAALAETLVSSGASYWLGIEAFVARLGINSPRVSGIQFLSSVGRMQEAVRVAEQRLATTPLSPGVKTFAAVVNMRAGNHETTDRLLEETVRLWPDHPTSHFYRFINAALYGDAETALARKGNAAKVGTLTLSQAACWQAFISARKSGTKDGARALSKTCGNGDYFNGNPSGVHYGARMLVALGDVDGAYDLLRGQSLLWSGSTLSFFYPEMAPFRADARFIPFIAPSGLLEYWTTSGHWPDFCSAAPLPYDCKTAAAAALKDMVSSANGSAAKLR